MYGGPENDPIVVELDSATGYCLDPFATNIRQVYFKDMFSEKTYLQTKTAAFWLDRNTPYLTGSSLKPEPNFLNLPFYPGKRDPSSKTLPTTGLHHQNNYDFYLHGSYGNELDK